MSLIVYDAAFARQVEQFAVYTGRTLKEELRNQAKGIVKGIILITPPSQGKRTRGANGMLSDTPKLMGQNAISRDLRGGGSKRGKRRAGVFTVLPDETINWAIEADVSLGENVKLWIRKDGTVYGTQRNFFRPGASMGEMRAHHKQYFQNGRMSSAGSYERGIGRWKWIDQMVVRESTYKRYLKTQHRKVGYLAGGFAPAARALGVAMPVYMKKQQSPGDFRQIDQRDSLKIVFNNRVGYADADLQRRANAVVRYQINSMERQIPHLMRKYARALR